MNIILFFYIKKTFILFFKGVKCSYTFVIISSSLLL